MITLYQFPISHYCEKAAWALDYKGIPYRTVNLVPGPHVLFVRRMAPATTVPVIRDDGKVIQDSTKIIEYLDEHFPERSLTPSDTNLKKEALEWEEFCDAEIGPHLRRFFYNHILPDRKLAVSLLLQKNGCYRPLYSLFFPLIRLLMRKSMNIHPVSAGRSEKRLTAALEKISSRVKSGPFLVGKSFTRADLTAASLTAPLFKPREHPYNWPDDNLLPPALVQYRKALQGSVVERWVVGLYSSERRTGIRS